MFGCYPTRIAEASILRAEFVVIFADILIQRICRGEVYSDLIDHKGNFSMTLIKGVRTLATAAALCAAGPAAAGGGQVLTGRATVIDGDTIVIHDQHIRLNGIDAPESRQRCLDSRSKEYRCGAESAEALATILSSSSPASCVFVSYDQYGRFVGNCRLANGTSVQELMVAAGHALDWPKHSGGQFASFQSTAEEERRGLWRGTFQYPWEWRLANMPRDLAKQAPVSGVARIGNQKCAIKGNISAKGDRIFHSPGQRDYGKIRITESRGERWFCSAEEALAAGWRAAVR